MIIRLEIIRINPRESPVTVRWTANKNDRTTKMQLFLNTRKRFGKLEGEMTALSIVRLSVIKSNITPKKRNILSVCVSNRYVDSGHKYRIDLIRKLDDMSKENKLPFDLHIYGTCKSFNFKKTLQNP